MSAFVGRFHRLDSTVQPTKFAFPLHPMDILLNLFLPVVGLHTENYIPLFSFHVGL